MRARVLACARQLADDFAMLMLVVGVGWIVAIGLDAGLTLLHL